ncbi:hypothetical protein [Arcticibacter tournemirensis]|uniref:FUSC family protein n=1 Tax=Arcticibacter tournemirensis TaxID=699437 RepID=A0A4Q0M5E8_9SPHI|nr:hypothetical protein [Arcticibacter tournemirensis]RXF68164.1 hypothetical protein EKH83_16650 [Arcticibacter tournemirensis]
MKLEGLSELSDTALAEKMKKIKSNKVIDAALVGFTLGIVVYSAVKNGFTFFTFFPLLLTVAILRNSKNNKMLEMEIEKEMKSRKSQDML